MLKTPSPARTQNAIVEQIVTDEMTISLSTIQPMDEELSPKWPLFHELAHTPTPISEENADDLRRESQSPFEDDGDWAEWTSTDGTDKIQIIVQSDIENDDTTRQEIDEYLKNELAEIEGEEEEREDVLDTNAQIRANTWLDLICAFFQAVIDAIAHFFSAIAKTSAGFFRPKSVETEDEIVAPRVVC